MALSPNYGFPEPDNSSLVKNGAQDIRALGDAVDTAVWNVGFGQAGKNKLINADMTINQRNFTSSSSDNVFIVDRWRAALSGATATSSVQTFALGTAPVAGYEAKNFVRMVVTTGNDFCRIDQKIESVRTFAGNTVTVSFWAKGTNPTTAGNLKFNYTQNFGTGGSPSASSNSADYTFVLTGNWTRYSFTFALPSLTGKTLGTNGDDHLGLFFGQGSSTSSDGYTLDLWGVQIEYGSKATPFQTASGGSPQAELAMCQRYYFRSISASSYGWFGSGIAASTTSTSIGIPAPVTMRTVPALVDFSALTLVDSVTATAVTSCTIDSNVSSNSFGVVTAGVASGLTQYRPYYLRQNANNAGYIGFSAEL
jgi:hypothetical protein